MDVSDMSRSGRTVTSYGYVSTSIGRARVCASANKHRIIMAANIGAIYGAQIFQADDKPRYRRAFAVNIGLLGFALILACGRLLFEKHKRRQRRSRL